MIFAILLIPFLLIVLIYLKKYFSGGKFNTLISFYIFNKYINLTNKHIIVTGIEITK